MGDTASNLGNAMDELMRHQPSLKADATGAIIKVNMLVNILAFKVHCTNVLLYCSCKVNYPLNHPLSQ
jgi:hypothetical protein